MSPVARAKGSSSAPELPERGRYRHFKGAEYELLDVGRHSETEELFVVYRSVDDPDTIWLRPLCMFNEWVDGPGGRFPRFRLTEPASSSHRGLKARGRQLAELVWLPNLSLRPLFGAIVGRMANAVPPVGQGVHELSKRTRPDLAPKSGAARVGLGKPWRADRPLMAGQGVRPPRLAGASGRRQPGSSLAGVAARSVADTAGRRRTTGDLSGDAPA